MFPMKKSALVRSRNLDTERRVELIARRQAFLDPSGRDSLTALLENKEKPRTVWGNQAFGYQYLCFMLTRI